MSSKHCLSHPLVHLAIDLQDEFIRDLSVGRRERFSRDVWRFAAVLGAWGIPTLRVVFGEEQKIYHQQDGNDVLIKCRANSFYGGVLAGYLRQRKAEAVIISGMETHCCVLFTIAGAVDCGFRCFVAYDLLADKNENPRCSRWHYALLAHGLRAPDFIDQPETMVSLVENHDLLAVFSHRPASPHRQTPDPVRWFGCG